jgi:hypothetical protein
MERSLSKKEAFLEIQKEKMMIISEQKEEAATR